MVESWVEDKAAQMNTFLPGEIHHRGLNFLRSVALKKLVIWSASVDKL